MGFQSKMWEFQRFHNSPKLMRRSAIICIQNMMMWTAFIFLFNITLYPIKVAIAQMHNTSNHICEFSVSEINSLPEGELMKCTVNVGDADLFPPDQVPRLRVIFSIFFQFFSLLIFFFFIFFHLLEISFVFP